MDLAVDAICEIMEVDPCGICRAAIDERHEAMVVFHDAVRHAFPIVPGSPRTKLEDLRSKIRICPTRRGDRANRDGSEGTINGAADKCAPRG